MPSQTINAVEIAKNLLLTPGGVDEGVIEKALGQMYVHKLDDADLYFQHTRYESWSLEEGIVLSLIHI